VARALVLAAVAGAAGLGAREALAELPSFVLAALCAAVVGGTYLLGLVVLRAPERLLVGETLRTLRRRR
jgi:putative peptidoglycan lipid II flippase